MHISACYIVKNEAENLSQSLSTIRDVADDLVIVDTGSTDATCRIAVQAGARVFHFDWRDDFAAARNYALRQAVNDWIIFLDADEGFIHSGIVRDKINAIAAVSPMVDAVMVTRINLDMAHDGRELGNDRCIRVLRRSPGIRYEGRIHENIVRMDGALCLFQDDGDLTLYHTGYSTDIIVPKVERNLRLLQQDMAEHGEGPGHYLHLADCYFGLRDYKQAMKYAILALDSPVQPVASRVELFHTAIESMRQLDWPMEEQLALAEMAIREYPQQPEFYGERGMILCGLGRLDEAKESLLEAIDRYEHPPARSTAETYFTEDVAAIVYARLGELEALKGETGKADGFFLRAMEANPGNERVREKYERFRKEKDCRKS